MRNFVTLSDFDFSVPGGIVPAVRTAGRAIGDNGDRTIQFIFSDESVARDNHVIRSAGWQLDNFRSNPVALWCHDFSAPPVGRVSQVNIAGRQLIGSIDFLDREISPFADSVFQMLKQNFLNATSVSWLPLKWTYSQDKNRPGGIDFLEQDLLEISVVPVPALPTALATARAAGIDTKPLFDWAERLLDSGGIATISRADLEHLRSEARMPTARSTDSLDPVSPEPVSAEPAAISEVSPRTVPKMTKRSLSHVGWLAFMLDDLGWLQQSVEWEAAVEEDGSTVPTDLLAAMKQLGSVLIAMTVEEVAELLAGDDEEDIAPDAVMLMASPLELKRSAFRTLRKLDAGALAMLDQVMRSHLAGHRIAFTDNGVAKKLTRAGRVLSADNERCLRDALELHTRACDMVRSVCDQNNDDPEDDGDDPDADDPDNDDGDNDDGERALRLMRERKAKALKLSVAK